MSGKRRPNFVVFMADQMRAPGPGGSYPCPTPHLASFAAEGATFTQALVPSPVCSPSRATFHTGLLPSFHGILHNVHFPYANKCLDRGIPTLASVLRGAGYRTALTGVWHASERMPVTDYGFDEAFGEEPMLKARDDRCVRRIDVPGDTFSGKGLLAALYEDADAEYGIEKEGRRAVEFLEQCAGRRDKPFFLFVSTRIPHVPWRVTRGWLDRVDAGAVSLPASFREDREYRRCPALFEYNGHDYAYWAGPADELRNALRFYYALISKVDAQFGVLLETLRRLGMEDDTFVLFASDHGEMGGAHNLVGKGFDFYDEVMRVPLIAKWPGRTKGGTRFDGIASFQDIMPTFCEAAGVKTPAGCLGRSLAPPIGGARPPDWRESILLEQYNHVFPGFAAGLRSADWLYVLNPTRGEQLYDRARDPAEASNLALDTGNRATLRDWRARMVSALAGMNHPLVKRVATAVGYLNMRGL